MRPTPINSAEAIFAPFFDERISDLAEWTADAPGANGFRLIQGWSFVTINWTLPADDGLVFRLHRRYDAFDCSAYDRVLACFNLPEDCRITLTAETDAGPRTRTGEPTGSIRREEWLELGGAKRLLALTVEVRSPKRTPGSGWLQWFGLQSTARLPHHLAQWAGYDEQWDKYLQPPDFEPAFKPTYGIMIDAAELEAVRQAFADPHVTQELRYVADAARRVRPESLIGENVNFWSSNIHRRERDVGKMITLHGSSAAQAGVLWRDKALCRLAARFALSLALCEHWEDIFFAHMRGCTWDQRGFVQSLGTWDCSIILDLCGEWFTPLGRDLILRKLATAGHGGMCHASWWHEYLYHTNQLAWISPARIYGLLVLEKTMPGKLGDFPRPPSRVVPHTDIAWANLQENLGHVLLADGSYLEGPMYFTWVARQAAFGALLYARGRNRDVREFVSPALLRTQGYAEMLLSTDDQQDMIMICDATFIPGEGLAFLAWLMPDSHWVTIFRKSFRRVGSAPLLVTLNLARTIPERGPQLSPFVDLPESGLMCSVRQLGPEYVKLFVMGNKAGAGHQHEDKGNFVLECAGDSFAMDFGVMDYANPVSNLMQHAQRHNVLTPWCPTERPHPQNPIFVDLRPRGRGDATAFHASMDLEPGWEGWFSRRRRTWDSPTPDQLIITDEWAVEQGEGVIFNWTTPLPLRIAGDRVIIDGRRAWAELSFPPGVTLELVHEPLLDPRRAAVEVDRRDLVQFGLQRAETQPCLRVYQRGRAGTFRTAVRLHLRDAV